MNADKTGTESMGNEGSRNASSKIRKAVDVRTL